MKALVATLLLAGWAAGMTVAVVSFKGRPIEHVEAGPGGPGEVQAPAGTTWKAEERADYRVEGSWESRHEAPRTQRRPESTPVETETTEQHRAAGQAARDMSDR